MDQATPSAAQPERKPIKLEAKQDGRRQAGGGGRVVVSNDEQGHDCIC